MGRRKHSRRAGPSEPVAPPPSPGRFLRWSPRGAVSLAALVALLACSGLVFADWWTCLPQDAAASYVGRESCVECHAEEDRKWRGSDHDLAMDRASPETVLGDFNDAQLTHFDVTSRMFRRDGKYMIHTEGPDGEMGDFEIKYVFGVRPLQQYMVEMDRPPDMPPGEISRVQVLRVTWDTEKQRWFYLAPPDVDEKLSPDDELHWTGVASRWNNMCADCHSTNLKKNFDAASKTYHTTFSEIDVSCEACHGPGSLHVELARKKSLFWDRKRGYGLAGLNDEDPEVEIQTCAPCHSRRRAVYPGFRPNDKYWDYYACELLQEPTYYPDGQILDEDYVFGSFIQSKMYHRGIRCTDCHDAHTVDTAEMRRRGNKVCTSCHQHPAGKYDSPSHHHHEPGTPGASCAECHMPETTYMEVDPRRDHSIRLPRPDLSLELGVPNACTRCHIDPEKLPPSRKEIPAEYQDWLLAARHGDEEIQKELARLDQWCLDAMDEWYGTGRRPKEHFAQAMARGRRGESAAEPDLIATARNKRLPDIVRATALMELGQFASPQSRAVAASIERLQDRGPQVRAAAVANLQGLSDDDLIRWVAPLLHDPVRLVRTEAARMLARVPSGVLRGAQRRVREAALDEFRKGVLTSNDRAGAFMTLGVLDENLERTDEAIEEYQTAIRIEPSVTGPRSNLAAIWDRRAEAAEGRARQAIMRRDELAWDAAASDARRLRGMAATLRETELENLARDVRLIPDNAALQYRYGLSLYLHGRLEEAETSLLAACRLEPNSPDFRLALALFYQKQQRYAPAIEQARKLVELRGDNPAYQRLLNELLQQQQQDKP